MDEHPKGAAAPRAAGRIEELEAVVARARGGDREALEQVVVAIQDRVFGLALKMLGDRMEAEDATQEILVKVITRLDSFRGESRFTTWVYSVASNHLRTTRARGMERLQMSLERLSERQLVAVANEEPPTAEHRTYTEELRLVCLHALLVCLDRDHRLAYLFGESLEMNSAEGAQVLGIKPATFRKRLSRARQRLVGFMHERCGLVRGSNPCHCDMRIEHELALGNMDPAHPRIGAPESYVLDREALEGLDELARISALFRTLPHYRAPEGVLDRLTELLVTPPESRPKA